MDIFLTKTTVYNSSAAWARESLHSDVLMVCIQKFHLRQ
uniref:Uncharacterized protein n=1 Tax=Heterorhabditis bacteriophora TaxID=37862 RepID=A0A1I7WI82_HETBA